GTQMELRIHDSSSFTGTDSEFINTYMKNVSSNHLRNQIIEKFLEITTIPQLQAFVQNYQSKESFKKSLIQSINNNNNNNNSGYQKQYSRTYSNTNNNRTRHYNK